MFQDQMFLIFSIFISILLLYYHRKLFFYPKELKNIPSLPIIQMFKTIFNNTPQDEAQIIFSKFEFKGISRVIFFFK